MHRNFIIIKMEIDHHTVVHMLGSSTTGVPASCTAYLAPTWIKSAPGNQAVGTDGSVVLVGATNCLNDLIEHIKKASTNGTAFTG
jgi:hypothetical protein